MKENSGLKRTWLSFVVSFKEKMRNPILVSLILFLPAYFIFIAGRVMPEEEVFINHLGEMKEIGDVFQATFTPVTASLVTSIFGLYTVLEARDADKRLLISGYSSHELLLSRFGMIFAVGVLVSTFSLAIMMISFSPDNLPAFFMMVLLFSIIYGHIGVIIGTLMDKMAGVYTILLLITMDAGIFQSPIFLQEEPALWIRILPAYHPMNVVVETSFLDSIESIGHLALSLAVLFLVTILAVYIFWLRVKS